MNCLSSLQLLCEETKSCATSGKCLQLPDIAIRGLQAFIKFCSEKRSGLGMKMNNNDQLSCIISFHRLPSVYHCNSRIDFNAEKVALTRATPSHTLPHMKEVS